MVYFWHLSDRKSLQVSRTRLRILADHNNAVIWMVSTRPLILSSCTNLLVTVPHATITIGITVIFMFHSLFSSLARYRYFSLSFSFILWLAGIEKSTSRQVLFFFTTIMSGRLAEIRWSVCISKSQRVLCISFSIIDSGLYIYHLFVLSNLNILHNSKWITSIQSCLVLYTHCASLLHSLIISLTVSSLSPHNL